jgi:hypothetical protein
MRLNQISLRWLAGILVVSISPAFYATSWSASAQGLNPKAPACGLLPIADLEAQFGAKAIVPGGIELMGNSTCKANLARTAVQLQAAPPGDKGVPTSIQMGLAGATMMLSDADSKGKQGWSKPETRDFGSVGCMKIAMPIPSTTCFLLQGGYLNLSISSEDGKDVSFAVVKDLLEKAAARRKTS